MIAEPPSDPAVKATESVPLPGVMLVIVGAAGAVAAAAGANAKPRKAAFAPIVTGPPVKVKALAVPVRVPPFPDVSVNVSIFATLEMYSVTLEPEIFATRPERLEAEPVMTAEPFAVKVVPETLYFFNVAPSAM